MPKYCNSDYIKVIRPLPKNAKKDIYDIPFIEKQDINISNINNGKWLINIQNVNSKTINIEKKIVHSFNYDNTLLKWYYKPLEFLLLVKNAYAICSFDFSMHPEMSKQDIIEQTRHNRWIGAFLQSYGKKVIACVGWVNEDTYDICFAGLRDGAVFIISTMSVCNDECKNDFLNGYFELRRRFPNSTIICVGNKIDGMHDDICYIDYTQTFGNWDKYRSYYQPRLFNWDLSEVEDYGI